VEVSAAPSDQLADAGISSTGDAGAAPSATQPAAAPSGSITAVEVAAAADARVASLEDVAARSPVISDRDQPLLAIAQSIDGRRLIEVDSLTGSEFVPLTSIELPGPSYSLSDRQVEFVDITGDGHVDLVIHLDAAGPIAVVASDTGGRWHLLPAADAAGDPSEPYVGGDPRVIEGTLTSTVNNCDPSCAEGTVTLRPWIYADGFLSLQG